MISSTYSTRSGCDTELFQPRKHIHNPEWKDNFSLERTWITQEGAIPSLVLLRKIESLHWGYEHWHWRQHGQSEWRSSQRLERAIIEPKLTNNNRELFPTYYSWMAQVYKAHYFKAIKDILEERYYPLDRPVLLVTIFRAPRNLHLPTEVEEIRRGSREKPIHEEYIHGNRTPRWTLRRSSRGNE